MQKKYRTAYLLSTHVVSPDILIEFVTYICIIAFLLAIIVYSMSQNLNSPAIIFSSLTRTKTTVIKFNIQEDTANSDMINLQACDFSFGRSNHLFLAKQSYLQGINLHHAFVYMYLKMKEIEIPDTFQITLTYDSALSTDEIEKKANRFLEQYNKFGSMYAKEHPEHEEKIFELMKSVSIKIENLNFEKEYLSTQRANLFSAELKKATTAHERARQKNFCIRRFNEQLALIANKATNLKKNGHLTAESAAMRLHGQLTTAAQRYFSNPTQDEYSTFQLCAKKDIEAAHAELDKHRGWKRVLGNIGLAILGLGILYLFALMKNKNLFFNKTDSSKLLECTENLIDNHAFKIPEKEPAVPLIESAFKSV